MQASPPSTPTSSRCVGQMPSIGTETRIVSSGMAATIVPKKLWPKSLVQHVRLNHLRRRREHQRTQRSCDSQSRRPQPKIAVR